MGMLGGGSRRALTGREAGIATEKDREAPRKFGVLPGNFSVTRVKPNPV
jgi:hypothetical protein